MCGFLVKVKVSTDMISVLLHFKLSLIKGSSSGHSHSAVRATHLSSPSAPQRPRVFQSTMLRLPKPSQSHWKRKIGHMLKDCTATTNYVQLCANVVSVCHIKACL